jgi:hypothetical protein
MDRFGRQRVKECTMKPCKESLRFTGVATEVYFATAVRIMRQARVVAEKMAMSAPGCQKTNRWHSLMQSACVQENDGTEEVEKAKKRRDGLWVVEMAVVTSGCELCKLF